MLIGMAIAYWYATSVPNIVKVIKLFMRDNGHASIRMRPERFYAILAYVRIRTHLVNIVNSFTLRNNVHNGTQYDRVGYIPESCVYVLTYDCRLLVYR
jgi:hypothetical protein